MRDTVIDPYYRYIHHAGERPGRSGRHTEARSEPRPHGEGDEIYVLRPDARFVQRLLHLRRRDLGMMIGRFARMQTALGRTEHVEFVRQDVAVRIDYPDPKRMRRALNPYRQHWNRP